ncbi:oligosaccharyltransferase complex subunit epsilon [Malassezia brasiliensis]|uniref:Dolichyl-diphosphooligosaccharide--protein glycosyltransferase subunit OST2 n=1 Tax=Malassezia brasiliensis TaxID=1821822 RepID=A0AAF0DY99_9BASI|nr:oligosaccharyltransferase complex subunit epsilon [Malassezia brasiliensis]
MPPKKAPTPAPSAAGDVSSALHKLVSSYKQTTPAPFKVLDAFLVFLLVTGIAQFAYCMFISNYPFNSFIAGFAATVGQFVLTLALRLQTDPKVLTNVGAPAQGQYVGPLTRSAFAQFVFASIVLHFFVVNFLG